MRVIPPSAVPPSRLVVGGPARRGWTTSRWPPVALLKEEGGCLAWWSDCAVGGPFSSWPLPLPTCLPPPSHLHCAARGVALRFAVRDPPGVAVAFPATPHPLPPPRLWPPCAAGWPATASAQRSPLFPSLTHPAIFLFTVAPRRPGSVHAVQRKSRTGSFPPPPHEPPARAWPPPTSIRTPRPPHPRPHPRAVPPREPRPAPLGASSPPLPTPSPRTWPPSSPRHPLGRSPAADKPGPTLAAQPPPPGRRHAPDIAAVLVRCVAVTTGNAW